MVQWFYLPLYNIMSLVSGTWWRWIMQTLPEGGYKCVMDPAATLAIWWINVYPLSYSCVTKTELIILVQLVASLLVIQIGQQCCFVWVSQCVGQFKNLKYLMPCLALYLIYLELFASSVWSTSMDHEMCMCHQSSTPKTMENMIQ